ncbi:MAG: hypothetical protein P8Y75_02860 [Nitrospirota bacterium]
MRVYFSDIFDVDPALIEQYGAFNISLINDLPLFIDPFLLFNREMSLKGPINRGLLKAWFIFPEVKQNWLGYSLIGNSGSGLGIDFARALHSNLSDIFSNFGNETITASSHLEKLCLIKENVGRDNISDFTTNLIKHFLLDYTQKFAKQHIDKSQREIFAIPKVAFNYNSHSWMSEKYDLPCYNSDFVLLTPKDILTKDDTWINKSDIVGKFSDIVISIPNSQLRAQLNYYFVSNLPKPQKKKRGRGDKQPSKRDIAIAVGKVINEYPELIDYYIRYKEDAGDEAKSVSEQKVRATEALFIETLSSFITKVFKTSDFYSVGYDTLEESYKRVIFLKNVIENKDGYRIFYIKGEPIRREKDLQIMFRLTWFASPSDVTREANEGRGPVDYKISKGSKDKTLVEFKLASNTRLVQNLAKQVEIYQRAHDTDKAIKVILFFSAEEEKRVNSILKELHLNNEKYVILIDARRDNKPSASVA